MIRLKSHAWPGNVRELENLVRRLAVLYAEETIGEDVIDARAARGARRPLAAARARRRTIASARRSSAISSAVQGPRRRAAAAGVYGRVLARGRAAADRQALAATRGNQLRAADVLGLNRNTLRKKIRELDIEVMPRRHDDAPVEGSTGRDPWRASLTGLPSRAGCAACVAPRCAGPTSRAASRSC